MARNRLLNVALGQRLLQSKLEILTGAGGRRPGLALTILTGGLPEPRPISEIPEPLPFPSLSQAEPHSAPPPPPRRQFSARTVYLADRHLRDLDAMVEALQPAGGKRLTRSAVLRQAIERLCAEVSSDPALTAPALEHPEHA